MTEIDTDSAFASNKFTVPSGEGGKYYLETMYDDCCDDDECILYKNGATRSQYDIALKMRHVSRCLIYSADYIEYIISLIVMVVMQLEAIHQ